MGSTGAPPRLTRFEADGSLAVHVREAAPFVKWAGGKTSLLSEIKRRVPASWNRYFEPFLGGGAVFFALQPKRAFLSDANAELINAFEVVRTNSKSLMQHLDVLPNTRDDYYRIRSTAPTNLSELERAARFIYLNKTCFRGLYRVNRRGEFNVPYGEYDRPYYNKETLDACARALSSATLKCSTYEAALELAGENDFVFLDPPYDPVGVWSDFKRYTPEQFGPQDHHRLAAVMESLTGRGALVMQTNSDTPLIRKLYSKFKIDVVQSRREINLNSKNRDSTELVIRNY